jgi:hypothetical protein
MAFFCDCARYCGGQRKEVSLSTFYDHKKHHSPLSQFTPEFQQYLLKVDLLDQTNNAHASSSNLTQDNHANTKRIADRSTETSQGPTRKRVHPSVADDGSVGVPSMYAPQFLLTHLSSQDSVLYPQAVPSESELPLSDDSDLSAGLLGNTSYQAPASPQDASHLSQSHILNEINHPPAPKPVPVGFDYASYKRLLQGHKTYQTRLRQVTDEHERLK